MIRPMRNNFVASYIDDNLETEAGLTLLSCSSIGRIHSRVKVVAVGPSVSKDITPGSVVWVQGQKSGIKLDENLFLISDEICDIVEIEE